MSLSIYRGADAYAPAYIAYLVHFHGDRDYFECHELLEEQWKQETNGTLRSAWLLLIQVAVALYHWRRGNDRGAYKLWASTQEMSVSVSLASLGICSDLFWEEWQQLGVRMRAQQVYVDWNIPIADEALQVHCQQRCLAQGWQWGTIGADHTVIDRHRLRDRSSVIAARRQAWADKHDKDTEAMRETGGKP